MVDECTRVPLPAIPDGQIPQLGHTQRRRAGHVEQGIDTLPVPRTMLEKLRREGERFEARPSPGRQAGVKKVLGVHHVRHRELFEVAASRSKCSANSRIHDARGLELGHPPLVLHQYRSKAVVEIFKDGDRLEASGKMLDEK
jgi:hypothetical protein